MKYNFESIEWALEKIKNGEHYYRDGNIVSKRTGNPIGFKCGKGAYLGYSVSNGGVKKRVICHRVIFALHHGIDELKKHETIDHIDGDKYNNRIENLQGLSAYDNSMKYNREAASKGKGNLSHSDVYEIRELLKTRESYSSIGRRYGVSPTSIAKIHNGETYRWLK